MTLLHSCWVWVIYYLLLLHLSGTLSSGCLNPSSSNWEITKSTASNLSATASHVLHFPCRLESSDLRAAIRRSLSIYWYWLKQFDTHSMQKITNVFVINLIRWFSLTTIHHLFAECIWILPSGCPPPTLPLFPNSIKASETSLWASIMCMCE